MKDQVPLEIFKEHFVKLSTCSHATVYNTHDDYYKYVPVLTDNFSVYEIERAINHLKNGKAAGDDLILSEFLTHGKEQLKHIIVDLFNKLYNNGYFPEQWTTGVIVPIFKKGDRAQPENYRGITLTSTLSKLFTYTLNQRMLQWSEENNVSTQSQFAYKPGYSTLDATFVLHSIIAQTMIKSDIFCAFIDFSKAFDKVERSILYDKLVLCGLSHNMLRMIINMYSKIRSKVKTSAGISDTFLLQNGLMQGECLSPTLFSLYINDIVNCIDNIDTMGIYMGTTKVSVLKYADDLVLIAKSSDGLQQGLEELNRFCNANRLTVNTDKSNLMCFTQKRKDIILPSLYYDTTSLNWVTQFKYLGVSFSNRNSFKGGLETLCQQAYRAQTVVDLHILKHKTVSVKYILDLFDTLVKPIIMYGSEVYGINNYKVVETFYLKFIKHVLHVKPSTNTCMVYAETGRYPVSLDINISMVKQWVKIVSSDKHKLIWIAYESMLSSPVHLKKKNSWSRHIQELLNKTGFGYIWDQQFVNDSQQFIKLFKSRCQDIHIQECFSEISKSNRCRLFRHIKDTYEMEPYLLVNYSRDLRQVLTKIRLSSHKLFVERGRWLKPKIDYEQRLCTVCDDRDIEDEYHILMKCEHYADLRIKFVKKYFYIRPSMHKFQKLMTTTNRRELFRLMTFIKFVFKDYNSRLTCD